MTLPWFICHKGFHSIDLFNQFVFYIQIHVKILQIHPNTISAGWGAHENGDISETLRAVNLTIVSKTQCQSHFQQLQMTQLCARGTDGGDTCQGDSGGPLFCYHNDKPIGIGIVSYGYNCQMQRPAVYTRICPYIRWIRGIIIQHRRGFTNTNRRTAATTTTRTTGCQLPVERNGYFRHTLNNVTIESGSLLPGGSMVSQNCLYASETSFVCLINRQWMPLIRPCPMPTTTTAASTPVNSCPLTPFISNGYVQVIPSSKVGIVSCNLGYRLLGFSYVVCEDGSWTRSGTCVKGEKWLVFVHFNLFKFF